MYRDRGEVSDLGDEHFEFYKDMMGWYRWSLRAPNGKIVADCGKSFKDKDECRKAIDRVKELAPTAKVDV
jgi:uncharacterized protein YegP (UPF0339 family)